jgi:hypothetical protein
MVFQLGPWGKVLVMGIGAGVVMITLIIVVCFVSPGCWGYEWIRRGKYCNRTVTYSDGDNTVNFGNIAGSLLRILPS